MYEKHFLLLVVFFFLSSCASGPTIPLDDQAKHVVIVEYLSPDKRSLLKEIDMVKCELGMNARPQEDNVDGCKNELRNKAFKLGGGVVLIESEKQTIGKDQYDAIRGDHRCSNCVIMRGIVFKRK